MEDTKLSHPILIVWLIGAIAFGSYLVAVLENVAELLRL
jgi:hypothetical protein